MTDRRTIAWLYSFVRPQLGRLAFVLGLSLAAGLVSLAQPYITKYLIDQGLLAGDFEIVLLACGLMILAALVGAGLGAVNRWHYVTASSRILFALRESVYRHLQTLSPQYYARMRGGDLMARLDGDVAEIQRFAVDSALAFVNGTINLVGAVALMIVLSPRLSLIAFLLLPAQFLFLRLMRPRIEAWTRTQRERASDLSSFFFETLGAMKFIQSVAGERREAERLGGLQERYFDIVRPLQMLNFATATVPNLLTLLSTALVFIAGGYLVIEGSLTLGTIVAFTAYLSRATGPVNTLLGLYVAMRRARVSLARIAEITDAASAVEPPLEPRPLPADGRGELRFDNVTFGYGDDRAPVLHGASLTIPGGAKVAILGVSGAGKTTLIDLLQRHYDPLDGRILIDGIDLREVALDALRRRVAVVAQDTVLFAGTIADNIRYAAPAADDSEVREAARLARVDEFVDRLPEGYETQVGSRGMQLSGGQRQRIAIARALLQDPVVLILDEATTGIDRESERLIRDAIDKLFGRRTRIVVSHHATVIEGADLVVELTAGKLTRQRGAA
jgi:ATP-binding cassette subfamily B protein